MNVPLSAEEKKDLLTLIQIVWGRHYADALRPKVSLFKVQTVLVVEGGLKEVLRCNDAMRGLVIGLAGGIALRPAGWLREIMSDLVKGLSADENRFNGVACRNRSAANLRSELEISLM